MDNICDNVIDIYSDDVQKEYVKTKRKNVDMELAVANKKIAQFEKRATQQDELATCYICLFKMRWPLQICETGHFACADCLCKQSIATGNIKKMVIDTTGISPKYNVIWKIKFQCGLCKKPANPKYGGPLVTQLIDSKPSLNCPTCNNRFSESLIGMHILKCYYNKIECPLCFKDCKIRSLNYHIEHDCNSISCKKCDFKSTQDKLSIHAIQHDIVERSINAMKIMISNLSVDVAMKRSQLLFKAMMSMDDILVGQDKLFTMTEVDQVRQFLNENKF